MKKILYLLSHPIQYQSPLIKSISSEKDIKLKVLYESVFSLKKNYDQEFNKKIKYDTDLVKDYDFESENPFNRVIGIDYNLASSDSKWEGKYYFHKSITPNLDGDDISAGFRTNYNSRNINFKVGALYIGDNFNSDLGYIKRKSIYKIDPRIGYTFWPENKKILNHQFEVAPL